MTTTTLASVCSSIRYGYTESANKEPVGPKFLRITDIVQKQIDWESVPYCKIEENQLDKYKLEKGDIVVARTGATVGHAKLIRDKINSVFASYLVRFRVDPKKANPHYVGLIVESDNYKRFVQSRTNGSVQPNASAPILGSFEFQLPSKEDQVKIAEILSSYDDLIAINQRRIALLEEAARRLYREWFVNLRFPGHESTRIQNGLPEGWLSCTLDNVCDSIGGGTPSTKRPEYWNGGISWITPTDITKNDCLIITRSEKTITEDGLKNSSAKLLPPDTILMTSRASIGYFALIDQEVCTNQGFISVIPKDKDSRMFLLFHLMHRVEELRGLATGATFKELSKRTFRALPITFPSHSVLRNYDEAVYPIIKQVRLRKKQNEYLTNARDLLLPRLMSGKLDVSNIPMPEEVLA